MIFVSVPQSIFADETDWTLLSKALTDQTQESIDGLFEVSYDGALRKVKLLSDIVAQEGDSTIHIKSDNRYSVELDLNGHTVDGNNKIEYELFKIGNFRGSYYCDLTIDDTSLDGTGVIKNGISRILYVDEYGMLTLNGGTITNDYPLSTNAVFIYKYPNEYYSAGVFVMNGGKITGITSSNSTIYNNSGIFIMNGGEISNNHCCVDIYSFDTVENIGIMFMQGGEISSNTSAFISERDEYSGAVFNYAGELCKLFIGGDAVIKNNTLQDNETISNVIINKDYNNLRFMDDNVLLSDIVSEYYPDTYKESFDKLNIDILSKAPSDTFDVSFELIEGKSLTEGIIATDVDYDLFKYLKSDNQNYYFKYTPEQNSIDESSSHFKIIEITDEKKITTSSCNHGSLYAYSYYAKPGDNVKIYYNADDGYILDSLSYKINNVNNNIDLTTCSFDMPEGDIEVFATFKEPNVPSPAPSDKPAKKYSVPNTGVSFFN